VKYLICALALSFGVAQAEITPGMLNQTHDGASIQGGTYFNSVHGETKFINSAGTGITLDAGQNIRGVEAVIGGYTGNGGNIHIQAPDQVVKLNGNIDVHGFFPVAMQDGNAHRDGNGGKVTVDAAYLFQNGNIYAGGYNGGKVQFNVGGMTMGGHSRIEANGEEFSDPANWNEDHGAGGKVAIQSTGDVNINHGAFIATNGGPIEITGPAVNMDGRLHAEGAFDAGAGTIRLTAADGDLNIGQGAFLGSGGGTVSLTSNHDINQNGFISNNGGSIYHYNFDTPGQSWTEGLSGGAVSLTAANAINHTGRIQADGGYSINWGDLPNGGVITVTAPSISNTGVIRAAGGVGGVTRWDDAGNSWTEWSGGNGGSVTFTGANPTGTGAVVTFGGVGGSLGTITAPDPAKSTNTLIGVWKKTP
jgi:hypothetical protein